ncbi:MAG TPA: ABC transporter permease [Bryobacteraceae bacterium]|nr:ABC transporter permease [Bryobacteraceae bacterium]
MKSLRKIAMGIIALIFAVALAANLFAPAPYAMQFRGFISAPASRHFWLGTDELGRDRWSRLLYGTRISLILAPAAAMLSTFVAVLVGGIAGYLGGWWDRMVLRMIDVFLSIPWLFLFLIVRSLLPLNASPLESVVITFMVMGLLGWAAPARVIRVGAQSLRNSDLVLHARACGCPGTRLLWVHIVPNLKPVVFAQFWIAIPTFILGEASLGLIGLGVAEPLPSWGNLLRELASPQAVISHPAVLAPLLLLVIVVSSFQFLLPEREFSA